MIMAIPFLGNKSVPKITKIGLAFLISIILFPLHKEGVPSMPDELIPFAVIAIKEIIFGLLIGFTATLLFAAVDFSGQIIGFQMGFGIANVIDPQTNQQVSIIAQFQNIMAALIFLSINAHHIFIKAISDSFTLVPLGKLNLSGKVVEVYLRFGADIFILAIKMSAPIIATLLLTNVILGIVSRTVPQINIFMMSFPVTIGVGLISLAFVMPFFASFVEKLFNALGAQLYYVMRTI